MTKIESQIPRKPFQQFLRAVYNAYMCAFATEMHT